MSNKTEVNAAMMESVSGGTKARLKDKVIHVETVEHAWRRLKKERQNKFKIAPTYEYGTGL